MNANHNIMLMFHFLKKKKKKLKRNKLKKNLYIYNEQLCGCEWEVFIL